MPIATPLARARARRSAADVAAAAAPAGSGSRPRSASRPGVEERAGLERAQPRLDALGDLGPRPRVVAGGAPAGVDEDVRAVEVAARGARAGLGDVARARRPAPRRVCLTMFSAVRRSMCSALLSADGGLVGDGLQQLLRARRRERAHARAHARRSGAEPPRRSSRSAARDSTRGSGQLARRVGGDELELAVVAVAQPDLAGVGAEQLARAARDRVVELLAAASPRRSPG